MLNIIYDAIFVSLNNIGFTRRAGTSKCLKKYDFSITSKSSYRSLDHGIIGPDAQKQKRAINLF